MDPNDYELNIDSEVAQARMEGVIEDDREQHDITFDGLTNVEILTLSTMLGHGEEVFAAHDSPGQAAFARYLNHTVQEQADDLFEELRDIHEPFIERAVEAEAEAESDDSSDGSLFTRLALPLRSPFNPQGPPTPMDRAWTLGMVMVLVQVLVAVTNVAVALFGEATGIDTPLGDSLTMLVTVVALLGALAITFALGAARGRAAA